MPAAADLTVSPEVAVARLVLGGATDEEIAARLAEHPAALALLRTRRAALGRLRRMAAEVDHAATGVAAIRDAFDRAVAVSPEGSVAAYSLGDPALLAAATRELVEWLARERLIGPASEVLDLGCGIGRVAAALAPRVRSVLGLDVSPAMIAEARRRAPAPNLRFAVTDGLGVRPAGADEGARFDLVLAVDCFPYLMQAGVAARHVADAVSLLRAGGALAILNLSYRADPEADALDARAWAAAHGLILRAADERPFAIWDGRAFVLGKP